MFQLTTAEWKRLRLQIETSKGRGGTRYLPYAFTEQGLAMLSGILNSDVAINVNISIMRASCRCLCLYRRLEFESSVKTQKTASRQYALNYQDLATKISALEQNYNKQFTDVLEALDYLTNEKIIEDNRPQIGFLKE